MTRPGARSAVLWTLLATNGCGVDSTKLLEPPACALPAVSTPAVMPNPTNALSAFVTAAVGGADSAIVRFGTNASLDSVTPSVVPHGDSVFTPVLGLHAETSYRAQVVAFNRCGAAAGGALSFTTGALPSDLPAYTAGGPDPLPGYVVFAAGKYGLAIDNSGRVVWYHRFSDGPGLNFQPQPNGRFAARPAASAGEVGSWSEINPDGTAGRTLGCARGLQPRLHDMIAQSDGSYWLLCDETRTVDLSAQGRSSQTPVLGTGVQHRSATGELLFEWSPFDHLTIDLSALKAEDLAGTVVNWTHGNALDLAGDGSLLVSFRNLSEVTKIDTRTGAVVWRMGGRQNQFAFDGISAPAFARQHGVRVAGGGRMLLLDNLGDPAASRARLFEVDEAERRARQIGAYTSSERVIGQLGGNTQRLGGGRTLVSFGNGGSVEEYDAAGNVVWRIDGNPGYVFRAQRIRSLYSPGVGDPR